MNKVLFLIGPTAVGKTECSLLLAKAFDSEIISADSMQVYQGLDIGTAKPSREILKQIPHFLIDVISPQQEFSVFDFRVRALEALATIETRGKLPLVVGGSGLYIKSLLDGLSVQPGKSLEIRDRLENESREQGLGVLYERLEKVDPEAALRIKPQDARRIIRALEIFEQSGHPSGENKNSMASLEELGYDVLVLGLMREREELYRRVEARVDAMLADGLLEEVRQLSYDHLAHTARQAVGYKELFAFLQGQYDQQEAIRLLKQNSRHLVKKQLTWFRKNAKIQWFHLDKTPEENVTAQMIATIQQWLAKK